MLGKEKTYLLVNKSLDNKEVHETSGPDRKDGISSRDLGLLFDTVTGWNTVLFSPEDKWVLCQCVWKEK